MLRKNVQYVVKVREGSSKRKSFIILDMKLEVIKQNAAGLSNAEICRQQAMKELSLCFLGSNRKKIHSILSPRFSLI